MKIHWIKLYILCISILLCFPCKAFNLSNKAEISVLTCSPGRELYSLFGHTAIRVNDPEQNYDQVFNFGTFDFQTPNFYLKYARGLLPYQLSEAPFRYFIYAYRMENRSVYSQTLKLDSIQRQTLFDLLLENRLEHNRYYLYNFLYDNCTTRSRDIIQKSLPQEISWNLPNTGKSYWNLLDEYLQSAPWVQWGIHSILGQRGNWKATPFQYMFLPDYLMHSLCVARYNNQPIAEEVKTLYEAPPLRTDSSWYWNPLFVFGLGSLLLMSLLHFFKSNVLLYSITLLFFLFTGILGVLIVFLGAFTAHPITAPNWNILWANPFNLIIWPFLLRKTIPHILSLYLKGYLLLLFVAIPVQIFTFPAIPLASMAFVVLMIYLCLRHLKKMA